MKEKAKKKSKPKQQFSYTCPHCHKQFQDSSTLYSHVKLHSTELPYHCELCDYKCKIKKYLTRHVKKTHTAPTGNQCAVCGKCFHFECTLRVHMRVHTDYKCKIKKYLTRHVKKTHTAPTGNQCAVCGKCFHFECKLRVHMRVHTGEKPYKCSECDKAFSSSYSLSGHKLIHTGEKPYHCQFCDYACRDTSTIRKHMERHMGVSKTYPCNICNKNYKNKRTLQIHVDEVHFELNTRKFPCGHCDKVFKTKGTLRIHWNTVHLKINRTKCEICGADVSKNNINSHMRRHIDVKPFKCSFKPCGKRFKDKSDLKRHCLVHYPDRQHACALCHRRFARKTRLNKHVSRHLNGYDVQCDYCGDMFATKLRLSTHITRSHGPNSKIYICDTCAMVFHSRRSITSHLMYGHGAEHDRVCQICKEDLNNYQSLKEHYLKHHNVKYNVLGEKKEDEDEVLIKEEPMDMEELLEEPPEFLYDVDIRKQDMDEEPEQPQQPQPPPHSPTPDTSEQESDSLTYSKKVLSEDISRSIIERDSDAHDVFDDFFIDHVLKKPEEGVQMPKHIVDEKKKECVEKRLEKLLHRVRLRKQCRVLEKLRIQYNRRIGMATSNGDKKEPKSIRYFKNTQKDKETENQKDIDNDKDANKEKDTEPIDHSKDDSNTQKIRARRDEKIKDRSDDDDKDIDYRESDSESDEEEIQNKKLKFNTHQCYICFKLFKTKTELKRHCRHHFDICNEKMLKKCPFCGYVTNKQISRHIRLVHKLDLDIPYARIKERDTQTGSKYVFEIDKDCDLEIIPSISNLNKIASMKIDEKNRADKNFFLGTTKLVKKGGDWMVEKEKVKVSNEYLLPEFSKDDYLALKSVGNNYLERIRSLSIVAKKRGLKILYPCEGCEKICLTMSALKLHNRKHEINPKRFKPKVWKNKIVNGKPGKKSNNNKRKKQYSNNNENTPIKPITVNKTPKNNKKGKLEKIDSNLELKVANRFADPNPVKNKHKCDKKLIEFYKNNIKGGDIEFWQFLKIFNRMGRENVNDFTDLENRFDFGMHNIKNNVETTENTEKLPVENNEVPNKIVSKKKAFTRAIMISKKEYLKRLEIKNQMRQRLGLLKT